MPKQIYVPGRPDQEYYDPRQGFFTVKGVKPCTLTIEHSLVSVSKWEAKWKVSYANTKDKTVEQVLDYIKCMTITQNVDPEVYKCLTAENFSEINEYIDDPMTATKFYGDTAKPSNQTITAERVYYWMIKLGIPMEFQKWHFNRLLTLIKFISIQETPASKQMSQKEMLAYREKINEMNKKRFNSKG